MALFQNSVQDKYIKQLDTSDIQARWALFTAYFHNSEIQENIRNSKEEQFQEGFLRELFVNILGYTLNPSPNYNLTTELKNIKDAKKADGAVLHNGEAIAVIELKGTDTTDLTKVETQAFGYKNNHRKVDYIIISNFEKLNFYINNTQDVQEFNLFKLTFDDFKLLYLCLAYNHILSGLPKKIKEESLSEENKITKELYRDYSDFKNALFANLSALNPGYDALVLYKSTQKLLDRLLFIFFAEDRNLLPPNFIRQIITDWRTVKRLDIDESLYTRFKKNFGYLNTGRKEAGLHDIFAYNGGLFLPDAVLDNVLISDEVLLAHSEKLAEYDFESEVDVNILGHIFENSLNGLDEVKAQLEGQEVDKSKTKRKKDGVFYTPKYITKYIVDNTVGRLCTEKKAELQIVDADYTTDKKRNATTKKALDAKLEGYRQWLLQITIVDPACGSGAFLNQALEFLIAEHRYIDELRAKLLGYGLVLSDVENSILENNLFGVDINEESVDIAKLSLWLRTARPNRKLNNLNNNIKCGNSLIDDPAVAGDKAFNWQTEFADVFAKGGFDVVIGNPPYGAKISELDKDYLITRFPFINPKVKDTYIYFTFKMLDIIKPIGLLGEIIPNTWMLINSAKEVRENILEFNVIEIIDFGDGVFDDATVESVTLVIEKSKGTNPVSVKRIRESDVFSTKINKSNWLADSEKRILIDKTDDIENLLNKLSSQSSTFDNVGEIIWGIKPYQTGHGTPAQTREMIDGRVYHSSIKTDDTWKPLLVGGDIKKYSLVFSEDSYIKYGKNLMYPSNENKMLAPKLLMRQTSDNLKVVYDDKSYYCQNSCFIITLKENILELKYLLAILNSRLIEHIYNIYNPQKGKTFAEIKPSIIKQLPIKEIPLSAQQPFIEKADEMLRLNKELQEASGKFTRMLMREFTLATLPGKLQTWYTLTYTEFLKELTKLKITLTLSQKAEWEEYFTKEQTAAAALQNQIATTDKQIDQMVYTLYQLTPEEIAIVEAT